MIIEYTSDISNLITNKADLVDGKVPAEQLPSYVDDVIEFNNLQAPDTQISIIVGNNSYKNQIRFINGSSTSSNRIGSEDKYPNMFVNFGENTSEDDWTYFEPEEGKIYVNITTNHSYRWSGHYLIDLDSNWSQGIKDLQENTVRTDSQNLSVVQQKQAFENLGMKVYVTDSSFIRSTLSAEEIEEVFVSKAILFTDTGDLFSFGAASSSQIYFYKFINKSSIGYITLNKLSGLVSNGSFEYQDVNAVHFTAQNPALTSAQQAQAWSNLGLDLVVLKFPKGVTSITLTDKEDAKLQSGAAVLVTTDSTDTTGNIYNANNHIFTTIDSKNTSQPLYYSLALFSGLLYCSYDRVSKKFTYQGIIRLLDTGAVRSDRTTTLAASQKDTALSNIGLGFVIVDYSELLTPLSDDRLSQLVNAKGVILTNTPDNYTHSAVFTAGTRLVNSITFSSVEDAQNINYIVLNIPNKVLSLVQTIKLVISDSNQNLSNTQKDTVLSNIGLNWIHVQYSLLGTTLDDATYTKIKNAYGIILTDVPSDYFGPREFICGSNNSDGTKVFAGLNLANTSAYIVLYVNHNLTNVRYARSYDGAVPYDTSKTLTSDQQDVALSNIGLNFVHVDYSILGTTVTDEMFAVINNARGIILVDIPSDYKNPTIFIKGNNGSESCLFVSHGSGTLYCTISLNKSLKFLSRIYTGLTYEGSVRYIEKQSLTDTQKQQARSNIGATSCYDEYKLAGGTKYTTEADFNAQLVKVMDMTVVE